MIRLFTVFTLLLFTTMSQAQVIHIDYGEGWVVPMNADIPFDVDQDGSVDLHINKIQNELGFVPEFIKGCIASPSEMSYVDFGAREMSIFNAGDLIDGTDLGFLTFIDDDRGSNWHNTQGYAEGWGNNEAQYIGFILLAPGNGEIMANNGWMKIKIDEAKESLVILELAYEQSLNVPIRAGNISTATNDLLDVESLLLAPNPVSDILSLSFDYKGAKELKISIHNNLGQVILEVNETYTSGSSDHRFDVSSLSSGMYYLQLSDGSSAKTKRFSVMR